MPAPLAGEPDSAEPAAASQIDPGRALVHVPAPSIPDLAAPLRDLPDLDALLRRLRGGGRFVADRPGALQARDDLEAVEAWLADKRSLETQRRYRREAKRLLAWAWLVKNLPLSDLGREDYQNYRAFVAAAPGARAAGLPPRAAVLQALFPGKPVVLEEPGVASAPPRRWTVYGPIDPGSVDQVMRAIAGLTGFLSDLGYLRLDPLARGGARRQAPRRAKASERALSRAAWDAVVATVDALPRRTEFETFCARRARILVDLMHCTAARRGDLAAATWGQLGIRVLGDGSEWVWNVVGKGNKESQIPVVSWMIEELEEYQRELGLVPWHTDNAKLPVLPARLPAGGRLRLLPPVEPVEAPTAPPALSGRQVYRVVKAVFVATAERLEQIGHAAESAQLRKASTHWGRHTSVTHLIERGVDPTLVMDIARHGSFDTTKLYVGGNRNQRLRDQLENASRR